MSGCIPDASAGAGCFSVKQNFTLSTAALGTAVNIAWHPAPNNLYREHGTTASTATAPSFGGNWSSATQVATIATLYGKYRPVSAGIRASYVGPTQTDGGVIVAGILSGGTPISYLDGLAITAACAFFKEYKTYPLRCGAEIRWSPQDEMDLAEFIALTATASTTATQLTTDQLVLLVYGCASSQAVLHVEAVTNFEGLYESSTFMPGGLNSVPPPAEEGWYVRAMNAVRNSPAISAVAGSAVDAAGRAAGVTLGTLANGLLAPGMLSRQRLPGRLRLEL